MESIGNMNDFIGWIVDIKTGEKFHNLQFEHNRRLILITKMKRFVKENWNMFKDMEEFYIVTKDNRTLPDTINSTPIEIVTYRGIKDPIAIDIKRLKEFK